ncbi:hypothetical protein D9M73_144130 [compost metagenome]
MPELRGLGGQRIHHHQPFQLGQRCHHPVLVGQCGNGVEALAHVAVDLALPHQVEHLEDVVLGNVQFRQVVVGPVVLGRGVGAVPGFHQADVELAVVLPVGQLPRTHRLARPLVDVGRVVLLGIPRQGQVARQQVGKQAEVGQALDIGVPAQGVHAAAGHADVAQQQLRHGAGADHLRAHRVLGPAQGVHDGHGLALEILHAVDTRLAVGGDHGHAAAAQHGDGFHRHAIGADDDRGIAEGAAHQGVSGADLLGHVYPALAGDEGDSQVLLGVVTLVLGDDPGREGRRVRRRRQQVGDFLGRGLYGRGGQGKGKQRGVDQGLEHLQLLLGIQVGWTVSATRSLRRP